MRSFNGPLGPLSVTMAAARPLVVAIDDAQWIDKASGAALAFALSRLAEARVDVILAWRRDEDRHGAPLGVEHAFGFGRVRAIEVGPLSIGALHALFRQQLVQTQDGGSVLVLDPVPPQ